MVIATPWPLCLQERQLVPIAQEAVWAPGTIWTGVENLAPTKFDPLAVQPIASRYTDFAILAHNN